MIFDVKSDALLHHFTPDQRRTSFCWEDTNLDMFCTLLINLFWIWVLRHVKVISFILSRINCKAGRKREVAEKTHLTTRKQNLSCLTCDPS